MPWIRQKESTTIAQVVDRFYEIYPDAISEEVAYSVALNAQSYGWLMEMTPLSWGASETALGKCGGKSFEVRHSGSHTFGR